MRGRSCASMWKRDTVPCPFTPQLLKTGTKPCSDSTHTTESPGSDGQKLMPSVSSAGCSQNIQKPVQGLRRSWSHQPAMPFPTLWLFTRSCRNSGQVQACYLDLYISSLPHEHSKTYNPANSAANEDSKWHPLDYLGTYRAHSKGTKVSTATQDQSKWKLHQVLYVGLAVRVFVCFLARVNQSNTAGFCQHGLSRDRNMQLLCAKAVPVKPSRPICCQNHIPTRSTFLCLLCTSSNVLTWYSKL